MNISPTSCVTPGPCCRAKARWNPRTRFGWSLPSTDIVVRYIVLHSPGGWGGGVPRGYTIRDTLIPSSIRLRFLKSVGSHYEFTNGSYLSIVCTPEAPSSAEPTDPFERVLSRITQALFSASVHEQEKAEAIPQLGAVTTDSVVPALRTFVQGDVARNDEFSADRSTGRASRTQRRGGDRSGGIGTTQRQHGLIGNLTCCLRLSEHFRLRAPFQSWRRRLAVPAHRRELLRRWQYTRAILLPVSLHFLGAG